MLAWIANVLLAAVLAFLLNSIYAAKRDRRQAAASLYAALQRFSADRELFVTTMAQAASGLVSYRRAVSHLVDTGVPDSRVLCDIQVIVNTDFPEASERLQSLIDASREVQGSIDEYALFCKATGSEGQAVLRQEHLDAMIEKKGQFDEVVEEFMKHVKEEMIRVTWRQAIKDVLLP